MTVTRVSRTKRSSGLCSWTLEFEFKKDSRNGQVSDWLRKICFVTALVISSDLLLSNTDLSAVKIQSFSARHRLQREGFPE